jgi:glycosyltransferase involved in cell wall biosynthesis
MKIVFILPGRGVSGGVRVTCAMATRLRDRGHDVRILYQNGQSVLDRAKAVRNRMFYTDTQDGLERFAGRIEGFRDLAACRFEEDELIVGVGMAMSAEMARLESLPNVKVQYIHGATPWAPELMQRALSIPLPKIIVASYLQEIVETMGRGEIVALIHNGVDRGEYFSSPPEPRDGVGLIYSSHWAKDPATTLAVIESLSRLHPALPIRVFGADRRPSQITSRMYCRYPSLEEARQIYSRSQVWVMASQSEGFSMPVLEAMACGCCVVATDCGGTRDMIVNGENGFLVPVGDPDGIVNKVELLLDDAGLRTRMRRCAEQTAQQFTWASSIDKLEATFAALAHDSCLLES